MVEHSSGEIVGTFLVGAVMGGIAALLLAPATGKETRERIGDWMSEGKDKAQQKLDELEADIKRRKEELLKDIKRKNAEKCDKPKEDKCEAKPSVLEEEAEEETEEESV